MRAWAISAVKAICRSGCSNRRLPTSHRLLPSTGSKIADNRHYRAFAIQQNLNVEDQHFQRCSSAFEALTAVVAPDVSDEEQVTAALLLHSQGS